MKRIAFSHPKLVALCQELERPKYQVVGILDCLWWVTGDFAPQGDIGRYPAAMITGLAEWEGDPDALIEALVKRRWLCRHPVHGLCVHDWRDHADEAVRKRLRREEAKTGIARPIFDCGCRGSVETSVETRVETTVETSVGSRARARGAQALAQAQALGDPDPDVLVHSEDVVQDVDQGVDIAQVRTQRLRLVQASGNDELGIYPQKVPFPEAWRPEDFKLTAAMIRVARDGGCQNPTLAFRKFRLYYLAFEADMQRGCHTRWDLKWQSWCLDHAHMGCPCQRRPTPAENAAAADERRRHEAAQRRTVTPDRPVTRAAATPAPTTDAAPTGGMESLGDLFRRLRMGPAAVLTPEEEEALASAEGGKP